MQSSSFFGLMSPAFLISTLDSTAHRKPDGTTMKATVFFILAAMVLSAYTLPYSDIAEKNIEKRISLVRPAEVIKENIS